MNTATASPVQDSPFTYGSFCTGSGQLDTAVATLLGLVPVWHADPSPAASAVLAKHFPGVPNHGDLRATDWSAIAAPDVVIAGFPCQPVSSNGRRQGINDERWLFDDIADAISAMGARPRLCVFENVAGLLSANRGHAMARVVHRLAALGYVGRYRLLRASDIGAPHRRARVFITAWLPGQPLPRPAAPSGTSCGQRPDAVLMPTPRASANENRQTRPSPSQLAGRRGRCLSAEVCTLPSGLDRFGAYAPAVTRWEQVTGRPAPDPTEPGPNGPRLSARFGEWLMGWPPGWVTDHTTREDALHLVGNGVVPQQAQAAYAALLT